jgi:hypothetical protein
MQLGILRFSLLQVKLHEIVRADEPEHDPHGNGEPSPGRVMHDGGCGKLIPHAASPACMIKTATTSLYARSVSEYQRNCKICCRDGGEIIILHGQ